jgi:hypothetical protein
MTAARVARNDVRLRFSAFRLTRTSSDTSESVGIDSELLGVGPGEPAFGLAEFGVVEQAALAAAQSHPLFSLLDQPAPGQLGLAPGSGPLSRGGPANDQHLMGHVDPPSAARFLGRYEKTILDESRQHLLEPGGIIGLGLQAFDIALPARIGQSLAELNETQENAPRDPLLLGRQLCQVRIGLGRDGNGQTTPAIAADCLVRGPGQ